MTDLHVDAAADKRDPAKHALHYSMQFDAAVHGSGNYDHLDYEIRPKISADTNTLALLVTIMEFVLFSFLLFAAFQTSLLSFGTSITRLVPFAIFLVGITLLAGQILSASKDSRIGLLFFSSVLSAINFVFLLLLVFADKVFFVADSQNYGIDMTATSLTLSVKIFFILTTITQLFVVVSVAKSHKLPGLDPYEITTQSDKPKG